MTSGGHRWQPDDFLAGVPCLDFANTVVGRDVERFEDWIGGYDDLIAWGQAAGVLPEALTGPLIEAARQSPDAAATVLERGRVLREAIYRVFTALADGGTAAADDLAVLNREIRHALFRLAVCPGASAEGGFSWMWTGEVEALDRPLWPVARSAAELLTSGRTIRVRQCAGADCGWLFLDTSKNRSRRWCDMKICGNRAKAHRHYERHRPGSIEGA